MSSDKFQTNVIEPLGRLMPLAMRLAEGASIDDIVADLESLRGVFTSDMVVEICGGPVDQLMTASSPAMAYYLCEVLIAISQTFFDKQTEAVAVMSAATVLMQNGHVETAQYYLQFACATFERCDAQFLHAAALQRLGLSYTFTEHPIDGLQPLERSMQIAHILGRPEMEAAALAAIGSVYALVGKPSDAVSSYNRAITIAREIRDTRIVRDCLGNLAGLYMQLKRTSSAKGCIMQALEIDRERQFEETAYLKDLALVAGIEQEELEFRQAEVHLKEALVVAKRLGILEHQQACFQHLMGLYEKTDNLSLAVECGKEAARIAHARGKADEEQAILIHLAQCYPKLR